MARERTSLQARIRSRQRSGFVGRQSQVVQYQENLAIPVDDERRRFLFNIHGDAGVGKTYLTRQLRQIAIDEGSLTAYIDETIDDVTSAMAVIAEEFSRSGARLGGFEKRAAAYRKRRHELEADPRAPDGVAAFITKTAVMIGVAAFRDVPVAGALAAPVDAEATADQVNRARAYLAQKFRDHADVELLLSPADALTPVFISEVNRVAADRPIALFFDTYERIGPLLDRWLRRIYDGQWGDLPDTLTTTISGQKPLDPDLWGDYLAVIADVALEPFSEAEARQYLASRNIRDESTIQVILTLSGRLPMWLATLAQARPADAADIGDPAGDAVERFLKWERDPAKRKIAITAALPRALDQDMLAAIAPSDKASELFDWLRGLPFMNRRGGKWAYHEVVRAAMLRLQLAQSPSEWRSNHIILAQANRRWAQGAADGADEAWANPNWTDCTREEMYHLLCADPVNNLPKVLSSAVMAAEDSVIRARQWADLIADAGRDTDDPILRQWGQRLRDGIHDGNLTQYLTYLISDVHLDESALIVALEDRGECHQRAGRYDEALADYTRALELDPGDVWALVNRGQTYRAMERHDEALCDLSQAIELNPSSAWAPVNRGQTYQAMKRYDEALADYTRALELDPSDAATFLALRGGTYQDMKRYDEALADYTRAIELDPSSAPAIALRDRIQAEKHYEEVLADLTRAIVNRGRTYHAMKRYDEALADYNQAIELHPAVAAAYAPRGATYQAMKRYEEALADYTRAIELDPGDVWALVNRGRTYQAMKRYDEALRDLSQAIELDPGSARAIALRGDTYQAMKRYEEALADYTRALELDPSDTWAVVNRGRAYQAMDRYEEALADYTRALELDPSDTWAVVNRGRAYQAMDRYEEALADYTRALELDPSDTWAVVNRGETYRAMERYEEALADYTQAIELDPGSAWAVALRGETYLAMERYDEALADLSRVIELDPGDADAFALRGRVSLEEAIANSGDVADAFRRAHVFALGHPAGQLTASGTHGSESDLLFFAADSDGREKTYLPAFTQERYMVEPLKRNPDWRSFAVLEVDGNSLFENMNKNDTIVINPWSANEALIEPCDRIRKQNEE